MVTPYFVSLFAKCKLEVTIILGVFCVPLVALHFTISSIMVQYNVIYRQFIYLNLQEEVTSLEDVLLECCPNIAHCIKVIMILIK